MVIYSSSTAAALLAVLLALPAQATDLWQLVDAESSLSFALDIGGAKVTGGFKTWTAKIKYDPINLEDASVQVVIDIASVHIDNAQASPLISTPTWLGTDVYPTARFNGLGFTANDNGILAMDGTLVLKGVDELVTTVGQITINGDVATARF